MIIEVLLSFFGIASAVILLGNVERTWLDCSLWYTDNEITPISYKRFKTFYQINPDRWEIDIDHNLLTYTTLTSIKSSIGNYYIPKYEKAYFNLKFWGWICLRKEIKEEERIASQRQHQEDIKRNTEKNLSTLIVGVHKDIKELEQASQNYQKEAVTLIQEGVRGL